MSHQTTVIGFSSYAFLKEWTVFLSLNTPNLKYPQAIKQETATVLSAEKGYVHVSGCCSGGDLEPVQKCVEWPGLTVFQMAARPL